MAEYEFIRMTFSERGHFSNTFHFSPVRKIMVNNDGLEITKGYHSSFYKWEEIQEAIIESKKSFKGYGRSYGTFIKRTFVLGTNDSTYKFDVSSNFPDFNNNQKLLEILYKNLDVKKVNVERKNTILNIFIILIALLILFFWGNEK